jgi:hypothetical protein
LYILFLRVCKLQETLDNCTKDLSPVSLIQIKDQAAQIADELMLRHKTKNQSAGQPYPDALKKFAMSLHLKSARAYRYVSSIFKVKFILRKRLRWRVQ